MFTGIIKEVGKVNSVKDLEGGKEFVIACNLASKLDIDQSISINGVCHTVTACDTGTFTVQTVEETLRKTSMGSVAKDDRVNLERSMRADRLLDGHIVQGHVDATGMVENIQKEGTDWLFTIAYPENYRDLIVGRGSIAIDGISLTVASEKDNQFKVAIIPYTFEHTNLHDKEKGDIVNLEFDVLGKYVVRYMENRNL